MQVTINANGKTVQAEISEGQLKELGLVEQLKKLGLLEDKPRTGYEGREECNNKKHYFVRMTAPSRQEAMPFSAPSPGAGA